MAVFSQMVRVMYTLGAYVRAVVRLSHLLWLVAKGWWWVRFDFPHLMASQRDDRIRHWALSMLGALGMTVETQGNAPVIKGPVLLVANHISWTDILALLATNACRFVAKSQVHHWPVVGTLAVGAGTLFIERESARDAMRVMHHMARVLSDQGIVAVFPEGTTGTGDIVMPFHANLFQAAIAANAPVQALALAYFDEQGRHCSDRVAFVGDDNMADSLRNILLTRACVVKVAMNPASPYEGQSRRTWARQLQAEVQALHASLVYPAARSGDVKGF